MLNRCIFISLIFSLPLFFSSPAFSAEGSNADHAAKVFNFEGDVRILKKGSEQWTPMQKGAVIEPGDQLLTAKKSYVEVVYDDNFLNIARIEEKTKAEFRTLEPTDVHMEDGTVYSALDGLEKGSGYQISTPTAVAGVRGTHLFTEAAGGNFTTVGVVQDQRSETSEAVVTFSNGGQQVVNENQYLTVGGQGETALHEGATPEMAAISQETIGHVEEFHQATPEAASGEAGQNAKPGEKGEEKGKGEEGNQEDKKPGDKPPGGGGDQPGTGGGTAGNPPGTGSNPPLGMAPPAGEMGKGTDAQVDALVDTALAPPAQFSPLPGAEGAPPPGEVSREGEKSKSNAESTGGDQSRNTSTVGDFMRFAAVGGMELGSNNNLQGNPAGELGTLLGHFFSENVTHFIMERVENGSLDMGHLLSPEALAAEGPPMPVGALGGTFNPGAPGEPFGGQQAFGNNAGFNPAMGNLFNPGEFQNFLQDHLNNQNFTTEFHQQLQILSLAAQVNQERFTRALDLLDDLDHTVAANGHNHTFYQHATIIPTYNKAVIQHPINGDASVEMDLTITHHDPESSYAHVAYVVKEQVGTPGEHVFASGTMHCTSSSCVDGNP